MGFPTPTVVGASFFTDAQGYKGDSLSGKMAYAELNGGTALGSLPYKYPLDITYKGKTITATKLDIGAGGGPVGGHPRLIDLDGTLAQALGFSGLDLVTIADAGKGGQQGQQPQPQGAAAPAQPYVFTRGTAENPDEDSWAAGCRLAQEVAWFLFPDGPRIYYSQGADLIAQKPVAVLDRVKNGDVITRVDATYDNTSLQFRATKKSKSTKAPRRSTVVKPNSSTQIKLDVVCAPLDFRGGEVVQLQGYGMLDGPWIVSDATRDIFQTYTEMTLTPPTAANLEPAAGAGSSQPAPQPAAGVIPAVSQAFQRLQQLVSQNIPYLLSGRNPATGLDCDGLVQQLAEAAGMDMKNGSGGGGALDVAELGKWGQAGPGQQLTLYFSNQHTFFEFNAPQPIGHIMADTMSGPGVHGGGGAAYVDWNTAVQRRWNVTFGPYTLRHWPNT